MSHLDRFPMSVCNYHGHEPVHRRVYSICEGCSHVWTKSALVDAHNRQVTTSSSDPRRSDNIPVEYVTATTAWRVNRCPLCGHTI